MIRRLPLQWSLEATDELEGREAGNDHLLCRRNITMTATLNGRSLLGFAEGVATSENFYAVNPATGDRLDPPFSSAAPADVESAARLACGVFATYARTSGRERAAFLRRIATNIEAIAGDLIERGHLETALPKPRLQGETGRTCGQLRLF